MTATLIACAHGTRSSVGQQSVNELRALVQELAPDVRVVEAYVDVHGPELDVVAAAEAAAALEEGAPTVIVPLLLSTGFHTEVDIQRAAADAGGDVRVAGSLGPHPLLAEILVDRVLEAGGDLSWPLVIAAAGSSNARAADDIEAIRQLVAELWRGPVTVGFAAAMTPTVAEAVDAAIEAAEESSPGQRQPVAVATYMLAPGYFSDLVAQTAATITSAPLGPDVRVAQVALQRYAEALVS